MKLPVFIGWDKREEAAGEVCWKSLERRSTMRLHVTPMLEEGLRADGMYDRPFRLEGSQRIDLRDGRPFSTDFAFTRFLVPRLMGFRGVALFCDCDFLFLSDVADLFELFDPQYAVQVVKHAPNAAPGQNGTKMDGMQDIMYGRKNWSSLVLWNCGHPDNAALDHAVVNHSTGQWLHAFSWLSDDQIGALPLSWNWLAGVSDDLPGYRKPDAVHFTLGGPWFPGYEKMPYAEDWLREKSAGDRLPLVREAFRQPA